MARPGLKPGQTTSTSFKPGQSGNPSGRPKFAQVSKAIRAILEMDKDELEAYIPGTVAEGIALSHVRGANADLKSAEWITDRAEGKAMETVRVEQASVEEVRSRVEEKLALLGWAPPRPN